MDCDHTELGRSCLPVIESLRAWGVTYLEARRSGEEPTRRGATRRQGLTKGGQAAPWAA